jgi:predicted nucleic acid-binding protein
MRYLLDTNILSELIKKQPNSHFLARLSSLKPQALYTSCICVMELRFGSALRHDSESFWFRITDQILSRVKILPFGVGEALIAGDLLASLQRTGQLIGIEDALIAATALHHQCTLVTANTRHLTRIGQLATENWLEPP